MPAKAFFPQNQPNLTFNVFFGQVIFARLNLLEGNVSGQCFQVIDCPKQAVFAKSAVSVVYKESVAVHDSSIRSNNGLFSDCFSMDKFHETKEKIFSNHLE